MKPITYTICFLLVFCLNAKGQATANVSANIITPTRISKIIGTPARVVTGKTDSPTKKTKDAPAHPTDGDEQVEIQAVNLLLSDHPFYTYSISLPVYPLIIENGASTISVDGFYLESPTISSKGSTHSSMQNINIKAQVNLNSCTAGGTYIGINPLYVVVNYN